MARSHYEAKLEARKGTTLKNSKVDRRMPSETASRCKSCPALAFLIMLACLLATACGRKDSDAEAVSCAVALTYQSKASSATAGFDDVNFQSTSPDTCLDFFRSRSSTNVTVRVNVLGEKVPGYLGKVDFGGERVITIPDNALENSIAGGSLAYFRTFTGKIGTDSSFWYLPWDVTSVTVSVTFRLPTGTATSSYPHAVGVMVQGDGD